MASIFRSITNTIQPNIGPISILRFGNFHLKQASLSCKTHRLNLGLMAGEHFFSFHWSKGSFRDPVVLFNKNITNELLPRFREEAFYCAEKCPIGLSTPNIHIKQLYNEINEAEI